MNKVFIFRAFLVSVLLAALLTSCKKSDKSNDPVPGASKSKKLGVYESDSAGYRELLMNISKIGNKTTDFDLVFDTGSGGMVIDANGIIPASMISSSGFVFSGDSIVVNGITITNQSSSVGYGDDNSTKNTVYGNLAYADVTVGDEHGNLIVKRLPFLLYYKAIDNQANIYPPHEFDIFGVSDQTDITFPNAVEITSPFKFYDAGNGLKKGFKMDALGTSNFSKDGTYAQVLTVGLTDADINSSGFTVNTFIYVSGKGYFPIVPGSIGLQGSNIFAEMIFDTGTSPYSVIEYANGPSSPASIKSNSAMSISTSNGFIYNYTTSVTQNQAIVENPSYSGSQISIIGLDFFINNEYLLDYDDHELGLKTIK
ncbi:MAG TPA: hypothetical protein VIM89_21950 [Mucilaginibacter sp.]